VNNGLYANATVSPSYSFICMHVCMYACMHVCMYACMLFILTSQIPISCDALRVHYMYTILLYEFVLRTFISPLPTRFYQAFGIAIAMITRSHDRMTYPRWWYNDHVYGDEATHVHRSDLDPCIFLHPTRNALLLLSCLVHTYIHIHTF
jgi:hypothetical protein